MENTLKLFVLLAAPILASTAFADGMYVRETPPVYAVAPALWTGFYIGANAGAGIGMSSLSNGQSNSAGYNVPSGGVMVGSGNTEVAFWAALNWATIIKLTASSLGWKVK